MSRTLDVRQQAESLFTFLREVVALRGRTVYSVDHGDYELVKWLADVPMAEKCYCVFNADPDPHAEPPEQWIEIRKPQARPHPPVPPSLKPWLDAVEVADSSRSYPDLRAEAFVDDANGAGDEGSRLGALSLEASPQILDQWSDYVERSWMPWAERDRVVRSVQDLYDDLFSAHQTLETRSEEFELLMGFGLLSWKSPAGHVVKRHLVTTKCDLVFDSAGGRITIGPAAEGLEFSLEQDMLDVGEQPMAGDANRVRKSLADVDGSFWFNDSLHTVLREWVNSAASDGEYLEAEGRPAPAAETMAVSWAPALLLRKRTDRPILDMYDRILGLLEDGGEIPVGVQALVSVDESLSGEPALAGDAAGKGTGDDRVYFPLEANAEQFRIVERLAASTGLLVQGPPGTGKSHTIANLITHLLASGQRVLVTSQTPRALRVLKDKMPPEIADLCVLLIGDDRAAMNDLEQSVQAITDRYNTWDEDENRELIDRLEVDYDSAKRREADLLRDLLTLREGEVSECSAIAGQYSGTLQAIAERLGREREGYSWLTPERLGAAANDSPLSNSEALQLLALARITDGVDASDLELAAPDLRVVPTPAAFEAVVQAVSHAAATVSDLAHGESESLVAEAARESEDKLRTAIDLIERLLRARQASLSCGDAWCTEAVGQVLSGRVGTWVQLQEFTGETLAWVDNLPAGIIEANVTGLGDREPAAVRADAQTLHDHLTSGGNLGNRLLRPKVVKERWYLVEAAKVDGVSANTPDVLLKLVQWCDLCIAQDRLLSMWAPLVSTIPSDTRLRLAAFHDYQTVLANVIELSAALGAARQALEAVPRVGLPEWQDSDSVQSTLTLIRAGLAQQELKRANAVVDDVRQAVRLAMPSGREHPDATRLLKAMDRRDVAGFSDARACLERRAASIDDMRTYRDLLGRLRTIAPAVAEALVDDPENPEWEERFGAFEAAWAWAEAARWLQSSTCPGALRSLLDDLERNAADRRRFITQLAEAKAWGHCFESLTEHERKHLMAWMHATRRIGKGTGKNAPRYRREARDNMRECRSAIPAWVMPIYRVAESITPGADQFDVVVVDEASQSGIDALFLQFLGKKMLIVGDDKQIAPEFIGTKKAAVLELRQRYIKDLPVASTFDNESSLFDQAAIHFRSSVRLKEHFRCMPEIIQFSNRLSYPNDPLIPLRQYGADRLQPIKRVYVPDGYQEGKSSRALNRPEADAVVQTILDCCRNTEYDGLTMGVVSLLGETQARYIERALIRELGPSDMEERRLVCGDAYSFQGDERNIMFLSMVSAAGDGHRIGVLNNARDERRFNVAASRARDQLWLFHSVVPSDLNPECMRAKLLDYCMHPMEDTFVRGTELPVDDLRRQASGARRAGSQPRPFDSWFEVDVYLKLCDRGFRVAPQHEVAGYRIDLVVEGGQSRLAIECDGDQWHGPDQYEADIIRQRQLERSGWAFWRVRGSEFYCDPDAALSDLWGALESRGIYPTGWRPAETAGYREAKVVEEPRVGDAGLDDVMPERRYADSPQGQVGEESTSGWLDGQEAKAAEDSAGGGLLHPVIGRLPLGFVPRVATYAVARIEIDTEVPNLAEVPRPILADWLVDIVNVEGPIHLDEAARRVARSLGIKRVGHVINAAFDRAASLAASQERLVVAGDFLWGTTGTEAVVRDRSALPPAARKIELVSDQELEWAICSALSSSGRIEEDDLPRRTMGVLGFERTSRDADARIRAALVRGTRVGAFVRVGSAIALVGSDGEPAAASGPDSATASCLPGLQPYEVAEPLLELRGLQFHELSTDYLSNALQGVIEVESPIHVAEAARRLANAAGLERVGHRIQSAVSTACLSLERDGVIERRGDFLWDPERPLCVRDRTSAPASLRDIRIIAPEEIIEAARIGGADDLELDGAVTAVSRALGFRRTGKDVHAVISAVLKAGRNDEAS